MSFVNEVDYGTPKSNAAKTVTLTIDGKEVTVPEQGEVKVDFVLGVKNLPAY